jgi:hypothetical protein
MAPSSASSMSWRCPGFGHLHAVALATHAAVEEQNPLIPSGLRAAMAVAVAVVLGGGLLLYLPARASRWIWTIGPFNSRFLGAIYLAELVGGLYLVVVARHLPARVVIPVAWTFTTVVFVASIIQLGDFDFDRRGPWAWMVAYGAFTAILPLWFGALRRGPRPLAKSPGWRQLFLVQGVILFGYGVAMLVVPEPLTDFWPWLIDTFHGRVYSSVFLTFGVGSLLLAARSAPVELLAIGLSQLVFGALSLLGLVLADARVDSVDWSSVGTVVWCAAMAAIAGVGLVMVRPARSTRDVLVSASPSGAPG